MLGKALRWLSDAIFGPVGRGLARTPITANFITIAGVLIVAVACWFIATGETFLGGLILIGGALFDTMDGPVAKAKGTAGKRGAFLDSTLDRLSDGLIFGAIAFQFSATYTAGWVGDPTNIVFFRLDTLARIGMMLAISCLVLGFLTSYIRARAESLGYKADVGIAGRAPRLIIVLAGLVFDVLIPALAVLAALSAVTVVHRFVFVWKQSAQ